MHATTYHYLLLPIATYFYLSICQEITTLVSLARNDGFIMDAQGHEIRE